MKKPKDWHAQKRILERAGSGLPVGRQGGDFEVVVAWNRAGGYTASLKLSPEGVSLKKAKGSNGPRALSRLFDAVFNSESLVAPGGFKALTFDVDKTNFKISRPPHPGTFEPRWFEFD